MEVAVGERRGCEAPFRIDHPARLGVDARLDRRDLPARTADIDAAPPIRQR
jgi:hypothetical protein